MPMERRPLPRGAGAALSRAVVLLLCAHAVCGDEVPPLDSTAADYAAINLTRLACNPAMGFLYVDGEHASGRC